MWQADASESHPRRDALTKQLIPGSTREKCVRSAITLLTEKIRPCQLYRGFQVLNSVTLWTGEGTWERSRRHQKKEPGAHTEGKTELTFSCQQGRSVTAAKRDGRALGEAAQVLSRSYTETATAAKHVWPKRILAGAAL